MKVRSEAIRTLKKSKKLCKKGEKMRKKEYQSLQRNNQKKRCNFFDNNTKIAQLLIIHKETINVVGFKDSRIILK